MEIISFFRSLAQYIRNSLSSLQKISVSVLFVFLSLYVYCGDPFRPSAGAREAGMGYICVMNNTFWSSFHNQASLALNKSLSFGFNYENRFNIRELGTRSAGMVIPAGRASLGAVYSHFGYSDYKREMAGLACGVRLSEKIMAGVQADYLSQKTYGEYSNSESITCEVGLIVLPWENIKMGIHLFNPVPGSIRKNNMPVRLRIGTGVELSKLLFAGVEAEMSSGDMLVVKTGFEYEAASRFWLRGGFITESTSFSFGLGYLLNILQLDISFVTHEKLGVTTSASLTFKIH